MITYPISGADLSVAAGGTRGGGELGDGGTLLTEADLVVSTLCPIAYEAWAHGARLWLSSEGAMDGAEDDTVKCSCICRGHVIGQCEMNKSNKNLGIAPREFWQWLAMVTTIWG